MKENCQSEDKKKKKTQRFINQTKKRTQKIKRFDLRYRKITKNCYNEDKK